MSIPLSVSLPVPEGVPVVFIPRLRLTDNPCPEDECWTYPHPPSEGGGPSRSCKEGPG